MHNVLCMYAYSIPSFGVWVCILPCTYALCTASRSLYGGYVGRKREKVAAPRGTREDGRRKARIGSSNARQDKSGANGRDDKNLLHARKIASR